MVIRETKQPGNPLLLKLKTKDGKKNKVNVKDIKKNVKNNCQKQRETSILIIEGVMMILVFETVNYYALNAIVQRQRLRHVNQKDDLRLARQRNVTKHENHHH
jgi:hypothetical protein